jgi:hypothetical protein
MTYDSERDETPSYEGEVTEVREGMRLRTKVVIGALGAGVGLAATGNWMLLIMLICAYVTWMFVRTWLEKRRRDRTWRDGGGTIERGGIL